MKKSGVSGEEETLRVRRIKNGVVVDHIPQGKAPDVLDILGIDESFTDTITIAMNVPSSIYGKKDIVKVENRKIKESELSQIALIAPMATVNVIKDYKVVKKEVVKLPKLIVGSLKCPNPNCVTNKEREPVQSVFIVREKEPLVLSCKFCERNLA
ncbi:MAG: aspartate carbamoyltransferase regulatory subunit [Candidatus Altiarchaeota archaeon]